MKKLIMIAMLVALPLAAFAEVTHIPNTYPSVGRGIRPLGMGNTFLTMKGTDQNTLYYNPAAIRDYSNKVKWTTGMPVPPFELSWSVIRLIRDVFNFKDDLRAQTTTSGKINVFQTFVDKHIGEFNELEVQTPLIAAYNRYFYASLITDNDIGISFMNRAFPNFEINARSLAGLMLGSSWGFFDERLEIGAAVKGLYSMQNNRVITESDILQNNFDDFKWSNWQRGLGVGVDVGAKYMIHDFGSDIMDTLRPTIGFTYQDIGNTKFRWMKKNGGPASLQQTINAGVGIHPTFGMVEASLMADFREINVKKEFLLKTNFGAEVRFPWLAIQPALRAGFSQGYPSVGGGLRLWKLHWNVAYYGREMGMTTREKGSYRIANEFTWIF